MLKRPSDFEVETTENRVSVFHRPSGKIVLEAVWDGRANRIRICDVTRGDKRELGSLRWDQRLMQKAPAKMPNLSETIIHYLETEIMCECGEEFGPLCEQCRRRHRDELRELVAYPDGT